MPVSHLARRMLPGSQAFSLSGGLTAEKGAKCMSATGGVTRRFFCGMEQKTLASTKIGRCMDIALDLMINEEIRDREVRLIDENGEQLGVMPTAKAMELAEERGLDLAKSSPRQNRRSANCWTMTSTATNSRGANAKTGRISGSSKPRRFSCPPPSRRTTFSRRRKWRRSSFRVAIR